MKSTLKIDFVDNGKEMNPVIIANVEPSDDVRDKLIRAFFEKLKYESNWLYCKIGISTLSELGTSYIITPITPEEFPEMIQQVRDRMPAVKPEK